MTYPHIRVYGTPACQACRATERWLDRHDVDYTYINLAVLTEAGDVLRGEGFTTLPVVKITRAGGDTASWDGYRPTRLEQLFDGGAA